MNTKWIAAAALAFLASCSSAGPQPGPSDGPTSRPSVTPAASPSPTLQPTDSPTRRPQPTATPRPLPSAGQFVLTVLPPEEPVEARMAIPGERVCFLVLADGGEGPVSFSVTADGAAVADAAPSGLLQPGSTVGEACVIPGPTTVEATAEIEITARRDDLAQTERRTIAIVPWEDGRDVDARPYFDHWISWLAAEQPELGITRDMVWEATFVQPVLVVSHYAYWSEDWEMVISWHVMIPPDDFSEVFLRRRFTESGYSAAYRIDSFAEQTSPRPIEPRDLIR